MKLALAVAGFLALAPIFLLLPYTSLFFCPTDVAERVAVPDRDWTVTTYAKSCSAIDRGSMEIVAENSKSKARVVLAKFGEMADSKVRAAGPHQLIIELPNLIDITELHDAFDDIGIAYKFTPANDPVARTDYHLSLHRSEGAKAAQWYEENVERKLKSEETRESGEQ